MQANIIPCSATAELIPPECTSDSNSDPQLPDGAKRHATSRPSADGNQLSSGFTAGVMSRGTQPGENVFRLPLCSVGAWG